MAAGAQLLTDKKAFIRSAAKTSLMSTAMLICGCAGLLPGHTGVPMAIRTGQESVYVIRRGWHTDVAFPVDKLDRGFFGQMEADLPGARYISFGFGDRHYVLARDKNAGEMVRALLPGEGLILATGLVASPQRAFGAESVVELRLSDAQASRIREFVQHSIEQNGTEPVHAYAPGPYPGSLFYAAAARYSALHTCNTWTADAIHASGVRVSANGVLFASQVWNQVNALPEVDRERGAEAENPLPAPHNSNAKLQEQGG